MSLRTHLTTLCALRHPLVCGPMANAAGGALAAQVSLGGGLGFLGAGYFDAAKLAAELATAAAQLDAGAMQRDARGRLPVGVGFLAWRLSVLHGGKPAASADVDDSSAARRLIDEALRPRPAALWLSFGDREEMKIWAEVLRRREIELNGGDGKALRLFVGVGEEGEAQRAVEEVGCDVLVVQGCEAGGHGLGSSPPLHALVPRVLSLLPQWRASNPSGQTPVLLGAGGLSNGRSLAALLALGAHGGVLGTRLLLTPEAAYSDAQKNVLLKASSAETRRTMAFDEARNTLGWPAGVDGRGVVNATVHAYDKGEGDTASRQKRYKEAEAQGDEARIVTWSGTGVGLMTEIKPAKEVIEEVGRDAAAAVRELAGTLQ